MPARSDRYYDRIRHYSPERVAPFNRANREYPQARETERTLLVERLDLSGTMTVVDTNAGGGYLSEGIRARHPDVRIVCVDPAESFADSIDPSFERIRAPLHDMPLEAGSVARVTNLVGLHHLEDKTAFYREALRVLAPGGRLVFADVEEGTPPARWLNGPVDRYTPIGHDGMFLVPGGPTRALEGLGFLDVSERHIEYTWDFPDEAFMVRFCRDLFRLSGATDDEVRGALRETLRTTTDAAGAHLPWSLRYVSAAKPGP